jgi:hypothetical protein
MNPYHDSEGKFSTAEGAAHASPTGREYIYARRDLHADGTWPVPERARPQFVTVPGCDLRAGEKAHGGDGTAYLVTKAAPRKASAWAPASLHARSAASTRARPCAVAPVLRAVRFSHATRCSSLAKASPTST